MNLCRVFAQQRRAQRQLTGGAFSVAYRFAANGKHSSPLDEGLLDGTDATDTVVMPVEEDPVEVLRRIQKENAAKVAALGDQAPPTPPRRSGKSAFFEEGKVTDGGDKSTSEAAANTTAADSVETQRQTAQAKPAAPVTANRPVGKVSRHAPSAAAASSSGPLAGRRPAAGATPASSSPDGGSNPFIAKLNKMEAESKLPSFPTYDAAAERRRRHIEEKIKEERKHLLVFRDVGMDLDKPILSRDVFLVFKYFRYGAEFAVDNELERQLRYFNEHAVNELKIIQDSKLMRGPPTLSKKRHVAAKRSVFSTPSAGSGPSVGLSGGASGPSTAGGGVIGPDDGANHGSNLTSANPSAATPFQITSSFPQVRCANLLQYCAPFDSRRRATLQSLLRPSAAQSAFAPFLLGKAGGTSGAAAEGGSQPPPPPAFDANNEQQMTTLSPASFRRPAVVIYSQLGQKFGAECDEAWRRLAYATICPAIVPYLASVPLEQSPGSPQQQQQQQQNPRTPAVPSSSSATTNHKSSPIDVVSLRSADLYKYRWVHALYVRRLAKALAETPSGSAAKEGEEGDTAAVRKYLTAASTFVGPRLLEPFYATLGLRNYLLPQVMLVDHEGVVRWLSGGLPDAYEAEHFPALLRQLEVEYYGAKRAS